MNPYNFFFPDNLRPPALREFWLRYLLMLLLGIVAVIIAPQFPGLWTSGTFEDRSVTCMGIVFKEPVASRPTSLASFKEFVYLIADLSICLIFAIYALLVTAIFGWRRCLQSLKQTNIRQAFACVIAVWILVVAGGYLFELLGLYSGDPASQLPPHGSHLALTASLLLTLVIPLGEELFVRFTIFQALRTKLPFFVSALIASILFALLHWIGYPDHRKLLLACLASLFFCWTYEKTGTLATPIAIHVGNDLFFFFMNLHA